MYKGDSKSKLHLTRNKKTCIDTVYYIHLKIKTTLFFQHSRYLNLGIFHSGTSTCKLLRT